MKRTTWLVLGGVAGAAGLVALASSGEDASPPVPLGGSGGLAPPPPPEQPGELLALMTQWQPVDAPDLPVPVLMGNAHYEGSLFNYTTEGGSHEMGPTQVEGASTGGACNNPQQRWSGAQTCPFPPPGNPATVAGTRWGRGCATLGFDPFDDVTNPVALVRVGLWNLHRRGLDLAARYYLLFPARNTRWWCGAVLCSFGPGAGWTNLALDAAGPTLLTVDEGARWAALGTYLAANPLHYVENGVAKTYSVEHNTAAYHSVDRKLAWATTNLGWTG